MEVLLAGTLYLELPSGPMRAISTRWADTRHSALVAEVDEDKDASIDYSEVMAEPLAEVRY